MRGGSTNKFKVGDRVKIIGPKDKDCWAKSAQVEIGKTGIVIGERGPTAYVFIPNSPNNNKNSLTHNDSPYT